MRSVDPAYRICSTARLSIWDILCEKTDQRNADFLWVSDHSVPLLPKHILKIMALSNSILDSRYVEQTGALALSLFNASIYCASWGSHDIPLAITSLLVSRVGIHSEASESERDFQLMLCLVSREFKTNIYTKRNPEILDHGVSPWSYISRMLWNKSTDSWFLISTVSVIWFLELGDLNTRDSVI